MPHIAGLRGVLPDPSRLAEVIAAPPELAAGLASGALVRDPGRSVYRYHQTFAGPGGRALTRKSFFCAIRLSPWSEGAMRPHEATTAAQRDAALAALRARGAHAEPLLAGVHDPAGEVERLFRRVEGARPTLEATTTDGTVHRLWRVQDAELLGKLRGYFTPKPLHLLAGHDRYEAMLAYQAELARAHPLTMYSSANYGLACIVTMDDPALVAAARHKVVRGVPASSADVLGRLEKHFSVEKLPGAAKDLRAMGEALAHTHAHQPAMIAVFAGESEAWKLTLRIDVSPLAEGVPVDRAIAKLDPVVVEHLVLAKALPGAQVTTEPDAVRALASLDQGAAVALILRPLATSQIAHVAELGQLLPPESTAFHPAIAPGLVHALVDPDDDLV